MRKDQLVRKAFLVLLVYQVRKDLLVFKEDRAFRAQQVLPGLQVQQDLQV